MYVLAKTFLKSWCRSSKFDTRDVKTRYVLWAAIALFGLSGPPEAFADQEAWPQELPKPKIKITQPLYKDWNFDKEQAGSPPAGFMSDVKNHDAKGTWLVTNEPSAPSQPQAVVQDADCSDVSCYDVILGEETEVTYVDVSVRIKLTKDIGPGKAGIVLGAKDHKNFYAAVVTPASKTVEAFLVRDGKATSFGQSELKLVKGDWHALRVQRSPMMSHDLFNVFFDDRMLLSLSDSTFKEGKVGLVTWGKGPFTFDNLRAQEYLTNLPLSRPPAY
ncbi:MAG: hypothetical protein NPIRA01_18100 [Nitrospirales bacterium]|nr:MAG: hypothetical protein NPIRA01_18100 [Nitrospirales bacterium]